jgi:hypothetical protein
MIFHAISLRNLGGQVDYLMKNLFISSQMPATGVTAPAMALMDTRSLWVWMEKGMMHTGVINKN